MLVVSVVGVFWLAAGTAGGGSRASSAQRALARLQRLPLQAPGVISSALGTDERAFEARAGPGGWRLDGGGVAASLGDGGGAIFGTGAGRLSLVLAGVGRGDRPGVVPAAVLQARGNRVTDDYGAVAEWFTAGPLGIEQGFTLERRPAGGGGALTVALQLSGDLRARLDGAEVQFRSPSGAVALRYGGLSAVDASGRRLPASLALEGGVLRLRVVDRGARYPILIDPFIQQGAKLVGDCTSSCTNEGTGESGEGLFGYSVALSSDGSTALIGAPDDSGGVGAAWVFTQSAGVWTEQTELVGDCTASCTNEGTGEIGDGEFGHSVALSSDGNTAVIGAPVDNSSEGAVWVFTRSSGAWTQQTELVGDCTSSCTNEGTGESGDGELGWSVALSGDGNTALFGAPVDNADAGAAWVFINSSGTWSQQGSKLVGDCTTSCANEGTGEIGNGMFGASVALSANGGTALIGANEDNSFVGAAWVFTSSSGAWTQQTELVGDCTTSCTNEGTGESGAGQFGSSVALSSTGAQALIGAPNDNAHEGTVWAFTSSSGVWTQQTTLVGDCTASCSHEGTGESGEGEFGGSVALSADGSTALIGAIFDDSNAGAAWVFTTASGVWTQDGAKLVGDCTSSCTNEGTGESGAGDFGTAGALSSNGEEALIGAATDSTSAGAAWAFARAFTWTGADSVGNANWSDATNWGGIAPTDSESVGALTFPALTSAGCTASSPTDTCYTSNNDLTGLSVNGVSIDDGGDYSIGGNGITLGAGGITAAPSASDTGDISLIEVPLALSADQTWSITAGSLEQQLGIENASVTGSSDTVAVDFSDNTFLDLFNGDDEVGAVTASGSGEISLFGPVSLNGTDGNAVRVSGGAGLFAFSGASEVGPLTISGGFLDVGTGSSPDGTLAVDGGVTLNSVPSMTMDIDQAGTTPSTDYSQLTASGNVSLGSATTSLGLGTSGTCPTLDVGDVDTLITTSGTLTGTFSGIPNGTTIPLTCSSGTPPTVMINYTSDSVTATVVTAGSSATSTTTSLSPSTTSPVTNQTVTLTATVAPSSATPSGTVEFFDNGTPISGCSSEPVTFDGSAYTASCQTSFTAASSPASLTATFSSSSPSVLGSSTPAPVVLDVGQDSTATALGVASASPAIGQSETYTATVTPAHMGSTEPSGFVEFLDGGTPIGSCSSQPLTAGASSSTATCTLSYSAAGSHSITTTYLADANFTGSTSSPAQTVTVAATATTSSPAVVSVGAPMVLSSSGAEFSGSVNPDGLATTAYFEYGLDPKYSGGGAVVYNQSTPMVAVGSDFSVHAVLGSALALVPNALYHVRLVATNSAGTTTGADQTFKTREDPRPPPPVLGKSVSAQLVSGLVYVRLPGSPTAPAPGTEGAGFVPLTEARELPAGTQVDARKGTIELISAAGKGHQTQTGTFSGAIFGIAQQKSGKNKGLTTLSLLEGLFPGGPTYAACKVSKAADSAGAHAAKLSSKVLQTLRASGHGRFSTKGRYGAATVLGTVWTIADRCNGTLITVQKDSVSVTDFVRHITVIVHAHHSYLAKAP